jgi:hypothetical protein
MKFQGVVPPQPLPSGRPGQLRLAAALYGRRHGLLRRHRQAGRARRPLRQCHQLLLCRSLRRAAGQPPRPHRRQLRPAGRLRLRPERHRGHRAGRRTQHHQLVGPGRAEHRRPARQRHLLRLRDGGRAQAGGGGAVPDRPVHAPGIHPAELPRCRGRAPQLRRRVGPGAPGRRRQPARPHQLCLRHRQRRRHVYRFGRRLPHGQQRRQPNGQQQQRLCLRCAGAPPRRQGRGRQRLAHLLQLPAPAAARRALPGGARRRLRQRLPRPVHLRHRSRLPCAHHRL